MIEQIQHFHVYNYSCAADSTSALVAADNLFFITIPTTTATRAIVATDPQARPTVDVTGDAAKRDARFS